MRLTVFIPAYNEAAILERNTQRLHTYLAERGIEHEILVISNGSSDNTDIIGYKMSEHYGWFRFESLKERGAGRALACGLQMAKGDLFLTLDMDLSSDLIFIDYSLQLLNYADLVVGSKTIGSQRRSPLRVLASQTYILFANLLFDITISDYSIGCKAFQRSIIAPIAKELDPWTGQFFEIALYCKQQGKHIVQVGIDCDDRRQSHFNLVHEGLYRYWHLLKTWWRCRHSKSWLNMPPQDQL